MISNYFDDSRCMTYSFISFSEHIVSQVPTTNRSISIWFCFRRTAERNFFFVYNFYLNDNSNSIVWSCALSTANNLENSFLFLVFLFTGNVALSLVFFYTLVLNFNCISWHSYLVVKKGKISQTIINLTFKFNHVLNFILSNRKKIRPSALDSCLSSCQSEHFDISFFSKIQNTTFASASVSRVVQFHNISIWKKQKTIHCWCESLRNKGQLKISKKRTAIIW